MGLHLSDVAVSPIAEVRGVPVVEGNLVLGMLEVGVWSSSSEIDNMLGNDMVLVLFRA